MYLYTYGTVFQLPLHPVPDISEAFLNPFVTSVQVPQHSFPQSVTCAVGSQHLAVKKMVLTVYMDKDRCLKVKPKHLHPPLLVGCSNSHKPLLLS